VVLTTHELEIVPELATRVIVFGDRERRPVASGNADAILSDEELLVRTNLIHEHLHHHGSYVHSHPHAGSHHEHTDGDLL
jgi:cobalt/nickel transport system ATP-binding protein